MAKPRLSTGRIPFQLGIDVSAPPIGTVIINACALLTIRAKPVSSVFPMVRNGALSQQAKPIAAILFAVKPIAEITQRSC